MDFETLIAEAYLPPPSTRRALREAAGLSMIELADALGCHRTAVFRWETGEREPKGDLRRRYAAFLEAAREAIR